MSILVDKSTRVVVQGITGKEGSFHATQCKAYGTQVVAGVTPGKAGQEVEGIPVFNTVRDAGKKTLGETTCIGIGGDPIIGTGYIDLLAMFEKDPETEAVVMIGEIGGDAEEKAAEFIKKNIRKPVIGFIAGITAPPGRRMGHAGAIITGGKGTATEKMAALEAAGVRVVRNPAEIGATVKAALGR